MTGAPFTLHVFDGAIERLAVAANAAGQPVSLYRSGQFDPPRLRLGGAYPARLLRHDKAQGGSFAETGSGEHIFLSGAAVRDLTEGAGFTAQIVSEARHDKLARAKIATGGTTSEPIDAYAAWLADLQAPPETGTGSASDQLAIIEQAFADAMHPSMTLAGGGRLQVSRTPALTAIDIDTAGRIDIGRASVRALTINRIAAAEAARQMNLRSLGGAMVLDCVAPTDKRTGPDVKTAFIAAHRAISRRKAECLNPSPFGLMETVIAWGRMPIADEQAALGPLAGLYDAIRTAEREALAQPSALLTLSLPQTIWRAAQPHMIALQTALQSRYGGRITITDTDRPTHEVTTL